MKKTLLITGITALLAGGSLLFAAEPQPQNGPKVPPPGCEMKQQPCPKMPGPPSFVRDGKQNCGPCPMMAQGRFQQKPCPTMGFFAGHRFGMGNRFAMGRPMMPFGGCCLMPRGPMNEDELAKFADLKINLHNALEDYRAEASEKNTASLRSAVDAMVTASQKYEIERCEKALARAKAAVGKKEQIIDRTMKQLTKKPECKFGPKTPGPCPVPPPAAK